MFGKSQPNNKPRIAGLDELSIATSETNIPVPYFAGYRALTASWIMDAVISHTATASSGGKSAKAGGGGSKNFFGHFAGKLCLGQLDFISGLMVNNELVWPTAAVWDSQIFKANRIVIQTGNAYQTTVETDQVPPNFPWTQIALAYVAGTYAANALVVSAGMIFKSKHSANNVAPPVTAISTADWLYQSTPEDWAVIGSNHFWEAGSIVAWEGRVYETPSDTNAKPPNGPWVLFKRFRATQANPMKITVAKETRFGQNAGPGDYYLYWGTSDQVLDASGEAILSALGHPAYRNFAVIVGKGVLFGTNTVTPPSVQILGGRAPVQSLIVDNTANVGVDATALDEDDQVNLMCVAAELLSHPVLGIGRDASKFDLVSLQAEADHQAANPELFYISPMFTSLQKVSDIVANLTSYSDSFLLLTVAGAIAAGHWPHGEAAPAFDATNTINRNNLTKELSSQSDGYGGTANSVVVSIQDMQAAFASRPCIANNAYNMKVTQALLSQTFDRPFITRFAQGLAWGHEYSKTAGDQISTATGETQSEKATAVRAGSLFLLVDDELQNSEVQRCTRRVISAPPTGTVKLTYETERGVTAPRFKPSVPNPTQATGGPSPSRIINYQAVQLPTSLAGTANTMAILAGRQNDVTSALDVWFQQADNAAFQLLATQSGFAVAAVMDYLNFGYLLAPQIQMTANSTKGNTYAVAGNLWNAQLLYTPSGGSQHLAVVGTDWTFNGAAGTVTITVGSNIPNGSDVEVFTSGTAFANVTQGNTYQLPDVNISRVKVFVANSNTSQAESLMAEVTDYAIDRVTGQITVAVGGSIATGKAIIVFYEASLRVLFSANTPQADIDAISGSLTQDQINDNALLVFAFQAADPSKYEIMSLASVQAVTPGAVGGSPLPSTADHFLKVVRAQYGTQLGGDGTHDWDTLDTVFIISRSSLTVLTHAAIPELAATAATAQFILSPQSAWVAAEISDLYDVANNPTGLSEQFAYTFNDDFEPSVTWVQLLNDGTNIASFAGPFLTTKLFQFSFLLTAPAGANITDATLTGFIGQQQQTLWSNTFAPQQSVNATAAFFLAVPGLWTLNLNVRCDDGSAIDYPLTLVGSPTPVQITVNTPAATFAPTPLRPAFNRLGGTIYNPRFQGLPTGLTVYYQLQPRGTALNPGSWTALTESPGGSGIYVGVPNFQSGAKTLYAYATIAGSTDSQPVWWNL